MKTFALCLLAASAYAITLKEKSNQNPAFKIEQTKRIPIPTIPTMKAVPKMPKMQLDAKIEAIDKGEAPTPLFTMVESIKDGFETLDMHNDLAEVMNLEKLQEEQNSMIQDIIEEANEEAADIIEDESDTSDAASEVEEVNEDLEDDIEDINRDHDKSVAKIAKKSVAAKLTNDTIKNDVIEEVVDLALSNASVESVEKVIEEASLPFDVATPGKKVEKKEQPNNTLKRMVCRNGECLMTLKEDPEFNGYLEGIIGGFGHMRKGGSGLLDYPEEGDQSGSFLF